MNVFVIGSEKECEELSFRNDKFEGTENLSEIFDKIKSGDVVIHFWEDESLDDLEQLLEIQGITVLLNSVKTTLRELSHFTEIEADLIGFNGISGFIDKDLWEVCEFEKGLVEQSKPVFDYFKVEAVKVDDRVGMVSPRVISMIINEAFYTVMEGTADKEDIDIAMKLGTNYPEGPFTWLEKIGIENVYEILEAIYEDTKEERYKICPLLKQEYLSI
jgi:3-hydroxybutyryl-CoA dehydrogenase